MQKIKKLSALLLAVVLMLVVMTGCGGGYGPVTNPDAKYVQNLNIERRKSGYAPVTEDSSLNAAAQKALEFYIPYENGEYGVYSEAARQYFEGSLIGTSVGDGYVVTGVGDMVCETRLYNSGSYELTGTIIRTKGSYIGIASKQIGNGRTIVAIVLVG